MKQWKNAWSYVPVNWGIAVGSIEDMTQKVWVRNNLRGTEVRVHFSNLYDREPLVLGHVTVGIWDEQYQRIARIQEVTYQGRREIVVPAGKAFFSDSVSLSVKKTEDLVISVYFKEKHEFYGLCQTWSAQSWRSTFGSGEQTLSENLEEMTTVEALPFFTYDEHVCSGSLGISGIQVQTEEEVCTVACFGDSITHMSFYFDPLLEILYKKYPGTVTLMNCGLGGNRILYDEAYAEEVPGYGKCFGIAGIRRFERDLYENTVPDVVFFMEGINDCCHGFAFHAENEIPNGKMLFQGVEKMIEMAHNRGSKIYISTVMPFGEYDKPYREAVEKIRQEFNELLRQNRNLADGFLDLDEVMRKPEDMHFMKDGTHLGDGVHPNAEGGRLIAQAIAQRFF